MLEMKARVGGPDAAAASRHGFLYFQTGCARCHIYLNGLTEPARARNCSTSRSRCNRGPGAGRASGAAGRGQGPGEDREMSASRSSHNYYRNLDLSKVTIAAGWRVRQRRDGGPRRGSAG